MDLTLKRFHQIEQIYHSMNVYRCIIIHDANCFDDFTNLQMLMINNDYTFGSDGRIYCINLQEPNFVDVDWASVSLIIDVTKARLGKEHVVMPHLHNLPDFCLLINI